MKKLSLTICLAFAFLVTAAVAQTTPGQQPSPSSPGMGQAGQQPGYPSQQPGAAENPGMTQTQTDQNANPSQTRTEKGEKRLKGCVQAQGGQYVLETKKGKTVALTGQDVSAHAGHEVSVKGNWESGGGSSVSAGQKGSEKTFNVANVEMISDTCSGGGKGKGSSGTMGTSPNSSSPSGNEPSSQQPPQNQPPQ